MPPDASTPRNRLLAGLPPARRERLLKDTEAIFLDTRTVLIAVDRPIEWVYFIEDGVASLVSLSADGHAVETATVGNEGMVGLPVFLGTDRTSSQAFTQIPGNALRMRSDVFREHVAADDEFRNMLNRYTQALFTLVGQSSACNRLHTVYERTARWLLLCHDRVGRDKFQLTQEFLSQMLGVRRATVNEAAGALQKQRLIGYRYGEITIRDRPKLEEEACECYGIIRAEFDRLLVGRDLPAPLDTLQTEAGGKSIVKDGTPRLRRK